MAGRRRPSGLARHERKFATARTPDGREAKIPQAKDAATYVCLANPDGTWPERMVGMLAYDMDALREGDLVHLKEMRPGHGMGGIQTCRVLEQKVVLLQHPGNWMQSERWLLIEPVIAPEVVHDMGVDDL